MRLLLLCLLLAGCASSPPQVVHLTWVKDPNVTPYAERVSHDTCLIVTRDDRVDFVVMGKLFREHCL
jgi:predicted component of type VI protein secretion system